MRYSMLVYITRMVDTMLEAAGYLAAEPQADVRAELTENGVKMLEQITQVLHKHRADIKSELPLEMLYRIEDQWQKDAGAAETAASLREFIEVLPGEVDYRVRAVFFAELGEKWDAMSSVYEFMRDDPRFDPVVVLIPIFRVKQQEGQQKQEIIYKDYLTPLGIPFYQYNQYSLEDDCPDLAFICNPYESVTLREFWPETIAKTTKLVYLPYFMPSGGSRVNCEALCQLSVYSHAWRVIGGNNKHFEFYSAHSQNKGANMLVTGLPKLDNAARLRAKKMPLPAGWEKLKSKKVFLWNSWYDIKLSSVQHFDEIIKWFREHEDCGLIWRRHPMTDAVTKLYHPELFKMLQRHIQAINDMPNCLTDNEVSYNAAFCFSDAMISDSSSIRYLYLFMDKPVLYIVNDGRFAVNGQRLDIKNESFITFIRGGWMETAYDSKEIIAFFERIYHGEDVNREYRQQVLAEDLSFADGACGERVCNSLWKEMHREDHIERLAD